MSDKSRFEEIKAAIPGLSTVELTSLQHDITRDILIRQVFGLAEDIVQDLSEQGRLEAVAIPVLEEMKEELDNLRERIMRLRVRDTAERLGDS